MPKYEHRCVKCDKIDIFYRSIDEFDKEELCPTCGAPTDRLISVPAAFIGTAVQHAEYNPGLGCIVRNKEHRQDLCKELNLEEIGSDYKSPDDIHKKDDATLAAKKDWMNV